MDKYIIGNNAGIVWRLLNNGKKWSYDEIKKASGLSDRDLNLAIGWLAREDKIYFETDKQNSEFMYLSVDMYI
ncbi:MAG: winged helix-turn-helix domain-containing protein [Phocaeicola sp.]|mgnify:FL=1|nr:winged helix-turn-helix domain-containing protein [Phocaeicola sp.]